jgi:hypothetical protein
MLPELGLAHDLDSSAFGAPADVPEAKADLVHAVYEKVVAAGRDFVSSRLTRAARQHGLALAMPEAVMARPQGFGRVRTTTVANQATPPICNRRTPSAQAATAYP